MQKQDTTSQTETQEELIFEQLIKDPTAVITPASFAHTLWGDLPEDFNLLNLEVIRVYIKRLRKRLGDVSKTRKSPRRLIHNIPKLGYSLTPQPPHTV